MPKRREFLLATLLLLLLAYRLVLGLNAESLWGDEGWSMRVTTGDSPRSVVLAIAEDRHPPLYFLLLYGWRHSAGEDEISLRLLAVFPSLLAGALIYRLGRTLFGNSAGLAALLVLALLDKQVVFSQEVRHYSWLLLWMIASSYALVRWMQSDDQSHRRGMLASPYAIWYFLSLTAGLYTHTFMLIVLLVQGVYAALILRPWAKLGRLVSLWALGGVAFAPWGLVFVYQYTVHGGLKHDYPLTRTILEQLTQEFLGKPVTLFAGLLLLGALSSFLRLGAWRKNRPSYNALLLPILGLVIPLLIIVGLPLLNDNFKLLTDRNLVIIMPALALLIGLGISAFEGFPRAALIVFILINGMFTRDVILNNPPMRPISRYIAAHQVFDQPVMMEVGGAEAALEYHLRQEVGADVRLISVLGLREDYKNKGIEPLTVLRFEELAGVEGLWVVYWDNDPEFVNALAGWGYMLTATANDYHLGKPIYMYRYDYAALLDRSLALFGGQMRLRKAAYGLQIQHGTPWRVALWWSADQALLTDYTVSVFLLDENWVLVSQHDGFPQDGTQMTSTWAEDVVHFDLHSLPDDLPVGDYQMGVKVYNRVDGTLLVTEEGEDYFDGGVLEIVEN